MKRLTVHLANVSPIRDKVDKKVILYNTITVGNLKNDKDVVQALANIRKQHTIATCSDNNSYYWKVGEEMYHTAWQK